MAYKFERCPKAVSGAAPVKYAQRLVQMCQEHLVQTQVAYLGLGLRGGGRDRGSAAQMQAAYHDLSWTVN